MIIVDDYKGGPNKRKEEGKRLNAKTVLSH